MVLYSTLAEAAPSSASAWSNSPSWMNSDLPSVNTSSAMRRNDSRNSIKEVSPFSPGSMNLALEMGQIFLMGGLSKYEDTLGVRLHGTYGVSDIFGFDIGLGFSDHSEGRFGIMSLLPGIRVNLAWYDKIVPYGIGGMGFYKPTYGKLGVGVKDANPDASISPILFGIHLGAGVNLELTKQFYFGASLTFHDMFSATKADPVNANKFIDVGGSYLAFLVNAGVTF